jgi:hypothetical protein
VVIVGVIGRPIATIKLLKMSDLIDISAKLRTALIHRRENDEPINHQVHSTTYVEDSNNILVAKSNKKIFVGANLCNNEYKIDNMSCVQIGSILLKIKESKDHVRVPQCFPRVRDTFLSSSTGPQIHPITKSQGVESPSLVQFPVRVQLGIEEQST